MEEFSRTEMLLGSQAMQKLREARVAVFGVGGVGGYAIEALARSGIGTLDIVDKDYVSRSNLNRQIIATQETIGKLKVDAAEMRIHHINAACNVRKFPVFFSPETSTQFNFAQYNYVIDAVDTVSAKLELIIQAKKHNVPIISAMGAGNKLDPTAFKVADISQTSVCPLARVMRRELKKRGIEHVKVVYSKEKPVPIPVEMQRIENGKNIPGSISFVPSVAGLILAGEVIQDLTGIHATL